MSHDKPLARTTFGLEGIIATASRANPKQDGDFEQSGLLHCGKCKTPKQAVIDIAGTAVVVGCLCRCADEAYRAEEVVRKSREATERISRLRASGMADKSVSGMTFSADNGSNKDLMGKANRYAQKWDKMFADNIGLVIWGDTGNGKTFAAASIANSVIDRGHAVLMTGFSRLMNGLTGLYTEERVQYIDSLAAYKLLVLDDLGSERETSYGLEQVYSVIDSRYKSGKPLIVTTNLTLDEMKRPKNMDYQRIYDRVLEMCIPIHSAGVSLRKAKAATKMELAAKELMG